MQPSIHYYVLSLSKTVNKLYEGFRDKLIVIESGKFPFEYATPGDSFVDANKLRDFFQATNKHFAHFYEQDPLQLVVVGEMNILTVFESIQNHQDLLIGKICGNYINTSTHDLGKIVWPVVKTALAGVNKAAMQDLANAISLKKVVFGLQAVSQRAEIDSGSVLYVEEDFHVRGSLQKTEHSLIISNDLDVTQLFDDVVDIIIEKVLKNGGTVIFLNNGALATHGRIALINR